MHLWYNVCFLLHTATTSPSCEPILDLLDLYLSAPHFWFGLFLLLFKNFLLTPIQEDVSYLNTGVERNIQQLNEIYKIYNGGFLFEHWNRMTYTTTTLGKSVRLKFCKYMMIYDDLLWFLFEIFCPLWFMQFLLKSYSIVLCACY